MFYQMRSAASLTRLWIAFCSLLLLVDCHTIHGRNQQRREIQSQFASQGKSTSRLQNKVQSKATLKLQSDSQSKLTTTSGSSRPPSPHTGADPGTVKIIDTQRYTVLKNAFGREPLAGEHLACKSEPASFANGLHQKLLEGKVTVNSHCTEGGQIVASRDWPATLWDMVALPNQKCHPRGPEWIPLPGHSVTKLGKVKTNVDVQHEVAKIISESPDYSVLSNNCRDFVTKLWERIKDPSNHLRKRLETLVNGYTQQELLSGGLIMSRFYEGSESDFDLQIRSPVKPTSRTSQQKGQRTAAGSASSLGIGPAELKRCADKRGSQTRSKAQ